MAKCAHFEVCGMEADAIPEGGHCILHAQDPDKDREAFAEALESHLAKGSGDFRLIYFCGKAHFENCTFEEAYFDGATFKRANFSGATFEKFNFSGATFNEQAVFSYCTFQGSFVFGGSNQHVLFAGAEVDFCNITLDPLGTIAFRNADLRRCRFLNTDVREIEFTSVEWCRTSSRWPGKGTVCVYDELCYADNIEEEWGRLERLYRELKQNYEDRKDYARAGDFHFREKEMRKHNRRDTPLSHRILLGASAATENASGRR